MDTRTSVLLLLLAALAGCASGVQRASEPSLSTPSLTDGKRAQAVTLSLSPDVQAKLADNVAFDRSVLLDTLKRALRGARLLAKVDDQSMPSIDIVITDLRARSTRDAQLLDFGTDHFSGDVVVKDPSGTDLQRFSVSVSYDFRRPGVSVDSKRMGWLYDKFAEYTIGELTGEREEHEYKALDAHDRAAIDSVSVESEVRIPKAPYVIGSEAGVEAMAIVPGAATASTGEVIVQSALQLILHSLAKAHVDTVMPASFPDFLEASDIDVGEIVRQQFIEGLKAHPFYSSRVATDGRYRFVLTVPDYGITKVSPISQNWIVGLRVDYKLLAPAGNVLASGRAVAAPFRKQRIFTSEEMQANPRGLKQAFDDAASAVVARLLEP